MKVQSVDHVSLAIESIKLFPLFPIAVVAVPTGKGIAKLLPFPTPTSRAQSSILHHLTILLSLQLVLVSVVDLVHKKSLSHGPQTQKRINTLFLRIH